MEKEGFLIKHRPQCLDLHPLQQITKAAKKKNGFFEAIKGLKLFHFMACTIQSKLVVILHLFVRQLSARRE